MSGGEMNDPEQAPPECSREQAKVTVDEAAAARPATATSLPTKSLLVGITILFAVVDIFALYYTATMLDRIDCFIGNDNDTVVPMFVWYTTWTLITTTATWIVYLKRRYFSPQHQHRVDDEDSSTTSSSTLSAPAAPVYLPIPLFRLCLPLSITVMVSFTFYLATNDWGRAFVDDELCYTFMDGAIPKAITSHAGAVVFLTLDRLANFMAHYVCAGVNIVFFWKLYTHEQGEALSWWWTLFPFVFVVVLSIAVVIVNEFVDEVYDTDNIFVTVAIMGLIFVLSSAAFFFRRKRSKE